MKLLIVIVAIVWSVAGFFAGAHYQRSKQIRLEIVHHYNEEANYYVQPDSIVRLPCNSSYIIVRTK